jgi:hypothetical protein
VPARARVLPPNAGTVPTPARTWPTIPVVERRHLLRGMLGWGALMTTTASQAEGSGHRLASYYARHQVIAGGQAYAWRGDGTPQRQLADVRQVGVSQEANFALRANGELVTWTGSASGNAPPLTVLMRGVTRFAAGQSGWFAIDDADVLWYGAAGAITSSAVPATTRRVAENVATACIGDSADYFVTRDGTLFVTGLAHRGQYGDGKLTAAPQFVATASDAVAVKAHTGHAILLKRDGTVMGTGGNRFGPLSSHGLGDKADRWGPIFEGAVAIATGSRHSAALRADGSLWLWGEGFEIAPKKLFDGVTEVAAGDTATIALTHGGELWQWERGARPRRVPMPAGPALPARPAS